MKKTLLHLAALAALSVLASEERWFYVSNWLADDESEKDVAALVARAADSGYDAMEFACGIERCGSWDGAKRARFLRIRELCDRRGIEIIPSMWSIGYGSSLWHDFNFAEGLPCRGVRMKVDRDRLFADHLPHHPGNLLAVAKPLFFDETGRRAGADGAFDFANLGSDRYGHGRVCYEIVTETNRQYRCDVEVKTAGLDPVGAFRLTILGESGRTVFSGAPEGLRSTGDWTRVAAIFNSGDERKVRFYFGTWEGRDGTFSVRNPKATELGLVEPLRRPGTPFAVRSAATGAALEEGVDYEKVEGRRFGARWVTDSIRLRIPKSSRVKPGDELVVDYYHPSRISQGQISVCMSEPALYDYFRRTAADVEALCHPKRWFLDLDEIRAGGTCAACEARKTDMAHILADCVKRQMEIIRGVHPDAEIWAWSDMFDPKHNAVDGYYTCRGSYVGSGELIPKDLCLACWYGEIGEASLAYFSGRGHKTLAAAYYDADDLEGSKRWLEACRKTPGNVGMMYTTWERKYGLLEPFGRLK